MTHLTEEVLFIYIFLFTEFIRVTLVNKIISVLGAEFHSTSSLYCVVYSSPSSQVPIHHHLSIYPPFTLLHLSPPCVLLEIITLLFLSISFSLPHLFWGAQFLHTPPRLPTSFPKQLSACFRSISLSLFCLLVHFVH